MNNQGIVVNELSVLKKKTGKRILQSKRQEFPQTLGASYLFKAK